MDAMTPAAPPEDSEQRDLEQERIRLLFEKADAKLTAKAQAEGTERRDGKSILEKGMDAWKSVGVGMSKAAFETSDFVLGEPAEEDKTDLRRGIEQRGRELSAESPVNAMTEGVSRIVTGLIGAGKLMAPVKVLQKVATSGKAGRVAYESGKAALGSTLVLDPHEERLADLVEDFPDLANPVTDYLASDPTDSAAEGRLKNAIESLGVDAALIGALKTIKFMRSGASEETLQTIAKLEADELAKAERANAEAFGMDFTPQPDAPLPGPTQANKDAFGQDLTDFREADGVGPSQVNKDAFGQDFGPSSPAAIKGSTPDAPVAPVDGSELKTTAAEEGTLAQIGTKPVVDPKTGRPVLPTEKVAKGVVKTAEVPVDEVEAILKGSAEDRAAITKFGTKEKAIEAGHKFSPKVPLPWQKLHVPGGTEELVGRTTSVLKARYDRIKGGSVMKDTRVKQLVAEIAKEYGEDPAMVIGEIAKAGAQAPQMVSQMEAGFLIGNKMFVDADDLATKIRNGNLTDFAGDEKAAIQEFTSRLGLALDTLASANSVLSNAGRTVRRAQGQFRIKPADIERLKSLDPQKVLYVMEKAGGDAKKVAILLKETFANRMMNEATWHLTNGLLWMWPTHLVNTTTNAFMLAARPTEKLFGSMALRLLPHDAARRAELSSMSRQALKEYTYTVAALADGWTNAVEAFKRGDSILNPHNTEYFDGSVTGIETQSLPWKPVNSVMDLAANAWMSANYRNLVGLPTRTLGAADEFFKTLRYRSVVQARAAVAASDRGLIGQDLLDYLQKAMDQAIDPTNGRALDTAAIREAQMVSFQQDLNYETWTGSTGRALQNLRKTDPKIAFILPFLKTPINVIRYGIKMTPGLNLLQREFSDALAGKVGAEAQAHAIGQMAMGSMFTGLAAHLALNGRFTGSGPDDFKLKQTMIESGWKPYSFVWQDAEGNTQYFQMGRFDPVGMAMGMVADIVALKQKDPDGDHTALILAATVSVAKNLGEKTFLLNINNAMEAFLAPEDKMGKFVGRTAGSMLPFSSLMRGHNPDPYMREARGFIDNALSGVPGFSDQMPLKLDIYGDPVERHVGVTSEQPLDVVDAEMNRIMLQTDKGIMKPATAIDRVDLRDITIAEGPQAGKNAYQRLQELSGHIPGQQSLKEHLAAIIQTEAYQDLVDGDPDVKGTRLNRLAVFTQKYREAAKKVFLRENVELQPLVKGRQREVRGALLEKRKEAGGQDLLNALMPQQ